MIVSRCREENNRFTGTTAQSVLPHNSGTVHLQANIPIFDVAMVTAEVQDFMIRRDFFNELAGLYVQ